ncbi:MAG: sugar O-acetyltransferase [Ekhidna sp.]|nr:sugar O-acetyltransferase [Ekhidna sp.]
MMTEKEKMIAGEMYNAKDPELIADRKRARLLFQQINRMNENAKEERDLLFYELIGEAGENLWVEPPFYCDYGHNIRAGNNFFMNFNCCILDVSTVEIGDNVMFAPGVQVLTATHPIEAKARNSGLEYAKPISIGNDVWVGGSAIICPGVVIGNRAVIGAGAVVTRDVSDDVFVAGNPAQVIKWIDN